jgi:4-carboxymuconolactone decarboxylase
MSGRLPLLRPADLEERQRSLYDSLVANEVRLFERSGVEVIARDGGLLGPFNPLLLSPGIGAAQIGVFRADKASTSLPPGVHEIIILTVGAAWGSEYELYAHRLVGKLVGLSQEFIEALVSGEPLDFEDAQEASAYAFTRELVEDQRVAPETYARAEQALGRRGLVDMVLLIGLYLTTCSIINAFKVPAPQPV